ncbi:NADP-dependent oxidoreductase domain-containing protein 1 [Phytophthora citrophthora]|uniref:NADP-dependent oxidoreductase domain-containing protein 1 n=1 Tax=Phytophthora citrophthora TaxID=4793 RepID=A0AAD9LFI9_9STRA|nr:NADP-dependent oxidoreductase domain-containing protein 1 [Phytophthora citrophthora]
MAAISPPASPSGNADAKNAKKPFKIRAELLAPTRLAPKSQLLLHTRSLSVQVIAHQVLLLVLACSKCYAAASKDPPTIGVLGGGNVGTAVVMTILANGYRADRIALSTRQPDRIPRCEALKAPSALPLFQLVPRYYDNARLARESDILVLCMPPSQLKSVTIQIRHALAANAKTPPLVISTLCGVTHQSLTKACGSEGVVRVQPDVAKLASQWYELQQAEEELVGSLAQISAGLPVNVAELQRHRQPPPLQLAVEAIAPRREDIRALVQAFALFCCRAWNQDVGIEEASNVLFGDKSELVLATLGQQVLETGSEKQNQEEEVVRAKTPLTTPSWPLEWEQDLAELQRQLVARALQ